MVGHALDTLLHPIDKIDVNRMNLDVPKLNHTYLGCFLLLHSRYSEPKRHQMILVFFEKSVGKWYAGRNNALKFVLDLLRLEIPYLFCESSHACVISQVATDFSSFLTKFIMEEHLEIPLLDCMESHILVS